LATDGRYYPLTAGPPPYAGPAPSAKKKKTTGLIVAIVLAVVLVPALVLALIALPLFASQRSKAIDSDARNDLSTLAKEVADASVDLPDSQSNSLDFAETVTEFIIVVRSSYGQDDLRVPKSQEGVVLQDSSHYESQHVWCVGVQAEDGKVKDFAATATAGYIEGAVCDPTGGTATRH
jgi:hypothetical protein